MTKCSFLIGLLLLIAMGAQAQIVTPYLDPGISVKSPAALGWRNINSLSATAGVAEGYVENGLLAEGGEPVEAGDTASRTDTVLPPIVIVLKNETFGLEIDYILGDGVLAESEINTTGTLEGVPAEQMQDIHIADKLSHLYLSALLGESLSIGLGYRQHVTKTKIDIEVGFTNGMDIIASTHDEELTISGLSLVASLKFGNVFYFALGAENMTNTGTYERNTTIDLTGGLFSKQAKADYVENTWQNTIMGIGMLIGKTNESQFRLEYSKISGPESKTETEIGKHAFYFRKQDVTYASLEVKLGYLLISYRTELIEKFRMPELWSNEEDISSTTMQGLGWVNPEGLSVVMYHHKIKQETNSDDLKKGIYLDLWFLNVTHPF